MCCVTCNRNYITYIHVTLKTMTHTANEKLNKELLCTQQRNNACTKIYMNKITHNCKCYRLYRLVSYGNSVLSYQQD